MGMKWLQKRQTRQLHAMWVMQIIFVVFVSSSTALLVSMLDVADAEPRPFSLYMCLTTHIVELVCLCTLVILLRKLYQATLVYLEKTRLKYDLINAAAYALNRIWSRSSFSSQGLPIAFPLPPVSRSVVVRLHSGLIGEQQSSTPSRRRVVPHPLAIPSSQPHSNST
mmetsp:Transcript_37997/g.98086  ORF Transcript_37997/g.98086 Transcript_37997/m.98086 type:complete len:167 (-) Transcript_37997:1617-2117(-)